MENLKRLFRLGGVPDIIIFNNTDNPNVLQRIFAGILELR